MDCLLLLDCMLHIFSIWFYFTYLYILCNFASCELQLFYNYLDPIIMENVSCFLKKCALFSSALPGFRRPGLTVTVPSAGTGCGPGSRAAPAAPVAPPGPTQCCHLAAARRRPAAGAAGETARCAPPPAAGTRTRRRTRTRTCCGSAGYRPRTRLLPGKRRRKTR